MKLVRTTIGALLLLSSSALASCGRQPEELSEGSAEPAGDSSPIGPLGENELSQHLREERLQLDSHLQPTELSCASAKPHVGAICQIAERLCSLEDPTSLDQARQCRSARESCEDARERYEAKCGG